MLFHLWNVVDIHLGQSDVFVQVTEVAVIVPVDEESYVFVTSRRAHVSEKTEGQFDFDSGLQQVSLRPQAHTREFFVGRVELDGLYHWKTNVRHGAEVVWIVGQELVDV